MRLILSTAALLALSTTGVAEAQRTGHGGGMRPGMGHMPGPRPGMGPRPGGWHHGNGWHGPRWGGKQHGRWWGGWRAPGGWGGYNRPFRGYVLPSYWIAPSWGITDWGGYGLTAPYNGYRWSRYYDDAVLIDGSGRVYDTIGGVDWDRYDAAGTDYSWDGRGDYRWDDYYSNGGAPAAGYDRGAPGAPYAYERRGDGAGGAVAGAVIGGVAGAAIAGKGNRLGGALIGGGVGAVTGYAIDRAEDRGRRGPPPRYGAGYPPPPPGYGGGYGPGPGYGAPIVTHQGNATVVTTNTGGGYYAGGYFFPPSSTTTITVAVQPVTTTTTEEIVTYRKARVWKAKPRWSKSCRCR